MTLISAALTADAAVRPGNRIARPIAATLLARRFPIMALVSLLTRLMSIGGCDPNGWGSIACRVGLARLLLDGAEGEPGDDVSLREERHEQHGQRDERGGSGQGAPVDLLVGDHGVDRDGQGAG